MRMGSKENVKKIYIIKYRNYTILIDLREVLKIAAESEYPVVIATVGGKGTRLYPLTLVQSKPLIPIVNYPVFMRMLEVLARQGIESFIFSTKGIKNTLYLKDVFRYAGDFSARLSLPKRVKFMYQPNYRDVGSADAVRFTMEYYGIRDEILVVSGDNIASIDLEDVIFFHRKSGSVATVLLKELEPGEDVSLYGVAEIDEDKRIVRFVEKPKEGETSSRLINAGIYLFSSKILKVLNEMGGEAMDIGGNLMPYLVEKGYKIKGYICPGYWADVGTPDNYLKTSLDILNQKVEHISFNDEHMFKVGVWIHPTTVSRFRGGAPSITRNTLIGGDSDIHRTAAIENSAIGDNCIIEEGVRIENSVVMDFVNIEKGVSLKGCIIGRYSTIGENSVIDSSIEVEISGRKEKTPIVGDGVNIMKNSILGPYKRVAQITDAYSILKTGMFVDLGYDEHNIYFIEK